MTAKKIGEIEGVGMPGSQSLTDPTCRSLRLLHLRIWHKADLDYLAAMSAFGGEVGLLAWGVYTLSTSPISDKCLQNCGRVGVQKFHWARTAGAAALHCERPQLDQFFRNNCLLRRSSAARVFRPMIRPSLD